MLCSPPHPLHLHCGWSSLHCHEHCQQQPKSKAKEWHFCNKCFGYVWLFETNYFSVCICVWTFLGNLLHFLCFDCKLASVEIFIQIFCFYWTARCVAKSHSVCARQTQATPGLISDSASHRYQENSGRKLGGNLRWGAIWNIGGSCQENLNNHNFNQIFVVDDYHNDTNVFFADYSE